MMMRLLLPPALFLCLSALLVTAVPDGFEDRAVIGEGQGLLMPTDFLFTPQGQLLVVNKGGQLNVFDDPNGDNSYSVKTEALDLSSVICVNGERGIAGIAIHPDFETNRFVYMFYTFNKNNNCDEDANNGPVNRLSRFVLPESNIVDVGSETVFFETASLEYDHHNSGDIAFGNDGNLWVSVGDSGSTWSAVSSNPSNLLGSMVRLTEDGGIPDDNPYVFEYDSVRCNENGVPPAGSPSGAKCQEIYSIGLRNPFRFALDPNVVDKVRFYINDVGQGMWEEVNEGGTDFAGADYGWPAREGPCPNNKQSGCLDGHDYEDPIHYYLHNGGAAVTGGAFVPPGVWPGDYDGAYLYSDFVLNKMFVMRDGTSGCSTCDPPVSDKQVAEFTDFPEIINMAFGPYGNTQALYYSGIFDIRRVTYVGNGNRSPDAVIQAEPTSGQVGVEVTFNGAGSSDPDGDVISYAWDFDGDGTVDSAEANPTYTYATAGLYKATLTVDDGQGGSHTAQIEIAVGNKPVPAITSPAAGSTFAVGDVITLTGVAADVEDGYLPDTSLQWEVRQHHNTHYHPFLTLTEGNNIVLQPAPQPEDYAAALDSYLEVILTATDADGLTQTESIDVQPRLVLIDFDTEPSGLEILLDGSPLTTPATATTWENHNLRVDAPDQVSGENGYLFASWSDGGEQSHTIPIPAASDTPPKFVAQFTEFVGTFAPTVAPTFTPECIPGSLGIVSFQSELVQGQPYVNEAFGVYAEQRNDGNLVVMKGTPDNPEGLIWESGYTGPVGNYFTLVEGGSNLVTVEGTPDNKGAVVWQSGTQDVENNGAYYFGMWCSGSVVVVMQGSPDDPGHVVWQSASFPGPGSPTIVTASPPSQAPNSEMLCTSFVSLGIVAWESELTEGQVYESTLMGVFAEQRNDGNLVVMNGTADSPGDLIWESGFSGDLGNYFTRVLASSNMITYKGTLPEDIEAEVWQTGTEGDDGAYFFGLDCSGTVVVVVEGTPEDQGDVVWQSAPFPEPATSTPTMAPSETLAATSTPTSASAPPTSPPSLRPSNSSDTFIPPSSSTTPKHVVFGLFLPLAAFGWLQ